MKKSTIIIRTLEVVNAELLNVATLLEEKQEIVNPNAKTKREIKVLTSKVEALTKESLEIESKNIPSEIPAVELSAESADKLAKLAALGITDNIKESSNKKTIFKAEFNNKADRTKCRNIMFGEKSAIGRFLLHDAKGKKEQAEIELNLIIATVKKYYVAEDKFSSAADYATNGMDENKRLYLAEFINVVQSYKKEIAE